MNTSTRLLSLCVVLFMFAGIGQAQEAQEAEEAETEAAMEAVEAIEESEPEIEPALDVDTPSPETIEAVTDEEDDPVAETGADEEATDQAAEAPEQADEVADLVEEASAQKEPAAEDDGIIHSEILMLQGHPVFAPEQAELVYRPLVNYLNEVTPYRFDLLIARDFHRYWLDIRRGATPDLVLEEAHITAYRIAESDYEPLVAAVNPINYSLLTSVNNIDSTLQDFVGRRVSSMPSPSLGYLVLSEWYTNPMQQPIIQSNATSWLDAIEIVFSMEADAAMAPRTLAERYVNMENVRTSQEFPGITVSASPAVPEEIREEIRQALLVLHENESHYSVLHELDIDYFVEAEADSYEGLERWLDGATRFY